MPLSKGKKNIGKNIEKLIAEGRPRAQAVAIALSVSGESKKFNYENTRKKEKGLK